MVGPVDNKENPAYERHQLSQRVRIIALCQKTKQNILVRIGIRLTWPWGLGQWQGLGFETPIGLCLYYILENPI